MRAFGITYDTGFASGGTTTREPFDPATVRRELAIIRHDLRCDAVRVTGGDADRLETAARHAAEAGLEVWYSPFTNGLTRAELLNFLTDGAARAEHLRRDGAEVVFLTGSEISLFTAGFLPGDDVAERVGALADPQRRAAALAGLPARVNAFLAEAVAATRDRFGGRIGYASLPAEGVDWTPFDVVASDAVYPDRQADGQLATDRLAGGLRALTAPGKPAAVTEFGCTTYRGAAAVAGRGDAVVARDDRARPVRFTAPVVRDEEEQAAYLRDLLGAFEGSGLDAAFVNTFARYDLPHDEADDDRDFDKASFGVVKVLAGGRTGTAYPGLPWEPKAAFRELAEFGRRRAAERLDGGAPPARGRRPATSRRPGVS
ncbi:MAG TPA: hypothetical protein VIL48_03680 [Acidimicrobiales bacterium]